jgi:hypothetical protein
MTGMPLFENTPQPSVRPTQDPMEVRQAKIDAAFEHANEVWKACYRLFVMRFAGEHSEFTAEECQLAYKAHSELPQPREWRASGGIFQKLLKEGKIKRIGTGWSKQRGVPVPKFTRS